MLDVTVVQPSYYSGDEPDKKIADFLIREAKAAPNGSLIRIIKMIEESGEKCE